MHASNENWVVCDVALDERNGAGIKALLPLFRAFGAKHWVSIHNGRGPAQGQHALPALDEISFQPSTPFRFFASVLAFVLKNRARLRSIERVHLIPNSFADLFVCTVVILFARRSACYVMDDFPSSASTALTRFIKNALLKFIFRRSTYAFVVSEPMRVAYAKRFGRIADLIVGKTWPAHAMQSPKTEGPSHPLRLVWIGSINPFYLEPLYTLREALNGLDAELDIYSFSTPPNDLLSPQIRYRGALPDDLVLKILAAYDFGLVTYSSNESTRKFMRLSFPSKMIDYLAAALPVLILAPADIEFVRQPDIANFSRVAFAYDRLDLRLWLEEMMSMSSIAFCGLSRGGSAEAIKNFETYATLATVETLFEESAR